MTVWAAGEQARGQCDRCGRTDVLLKELDRQFINRKDSGLKVCDECLDIDHEQWDVGKFPIWDPQALKDARPDGSELGSTTYFAWNPVASLYMTASVGTVTVTIA